MKAAPYGVAFFVPNVFVRKYMQMDDSLFYK